MKHAVARWAIALAFAVCAAWPALAASARSKPGDAVVGVIADTPESFDVLLRLSRGLDHVKGLRVIPMAGKGPVQTLTDLVQLRGVDAALVTSDTLSYVESNNLLPGVKDKVSLLVRLGGLDVHVVARPDIASFDDLSGKTIATGSTGSASFVAAQMLSATAGISARSIVADGPDAVTAVIQGQADAAIIVGRTPLDALKDTTGVRLLSIAMPEVLQDGYSPALLSHEDYPGLIAEGQTVETFSAALVVAAFNWKRGSPQYVRTKQFTEALFGALQPGNDNDASLNLAASVPGWTRNAAAEDALKTRSEDQTTASP